MKIRTNIRGGGANSKNLINKGNFKKNIVPGLLLISLVVLVVGVTLTALTYMNSSDDNSIATGRISMNYTEPSNALTLENALPMSDEEGVNQTNFFEFTVTSNATTNANDNVGVIIPYEINISDIAIDTDKTILPKDKIKVAVTKVVDGNEETIMEPTLISNMKASTLREASSKAYDTVNVHKNNNGSITTRYRLRVWIDKGFELDNTLTYQYKFRVNVNSKVGVLEKEKSNLSRTWATDINADFGDALYTLDTKELPETFKHDNKIYTKVSVSDVSEQQNGDVLCGKYETEEKNKYGYPISSILILGQDGGVVAPEICGGLFTISVYVGTGLYEAYSIPYIDLTNFDTSQVIDMNSMFSEAVNGELYGAITTIIGLENFDTSNVVNMSAMFADCRNLTNIDLSSFDTSNVTDMGAMFYGCSNLINIDLSSFDTSKVSNMERMFYSCSSLTNLDLSSFDTSNVTDMGAMFYGCSGLTLIKVGCGWDMTNVTNSGYMFTNCGTSSVTKVCNE